MTRELARSSGRRPEDQPCVGGIRRLVFCVAHPPRVADGSVACVDWVTIEVINGVGHPLWSLRTGGYTPGVATAPVLLVIALYLARQLRTIARHSSATA